MSNQVFEVSNLEWLWRGSIEDSGEVLETTIMPKHCALQIVLLPTLKLFNFMIFHVLGGFSLKNYMFYIMFDYNLQNIIGPIHSVLVSIYG